MLRKHLTSGMVLGMSIEMCHVSTITLMSGIMPCAILVMQGGGHCRLHLCSSAAQSHTWCISEPMIRHCYIDSEGGISNVNRIIRERLCLEQSTVWENHNKLPRHKDYVHVITITTPVPSYTHVSQNQPRACMMS